MRTIHEIAAELDRAAAAGDAVQPLHETDPDLDAPGAYAVQAAWARLRTGRGERVVGYKIGLAGEASRRQFGVDEPESGCLFDAMLLPAGGEVTAAALIQPMAEPEIAFRLARELRGPGVTEDDVRHATAHVCPALEIVDSRIRDWRIALVDTVADNASSARVVLGDAVPLDDRDLASTEGAVLRDGEVMAEGVGASVFGGPLRAVAWLANHLAGMGLALEAGHVVMPGSVTAPYPMTAGHSYAARFTGLGEVSVRLT